MYKNKFEQWGFAKNITNKNVRGLLSHKILSDATGCVSTLGTHGRPVQKQRLSKFLKRKKMNPADSLLVNDDRPADVYHAVGVDHILTTPLSHEGILDGLDTYPNLHDVTPADSGYEQACHYRPWKKKFRLIETFPE